MYSVSKSLVSVDDVPAAFQRQDPEVAQLCPLGASLVSPTEDELYR